MADSVVRLSIESHEFDAKIKRAGEALNKYFDIARKGDRTFAVLDEGVMDVIKSFGKMETSSKSARGQLSELTKGFTDLSFIYKRLTAEEKASPVGIEIAKSLDELKKRIQDTKKDLASINQELSGSKFGQFGGIIDGIGHKMGVSANLTELLTSKTALMTAGIGAAVAAIYKGTEAWTKYNAELSKQDQITQVTTGLKGSSADHVTDVMRAISDTYKVDFRQAVEAANTLMSQFGVSGSEAIQLIKDGMQGMIHGDGPKLLNMIQQYAPAFRDAGVSASQLVAVIHNSEGGIFTDQNMSAIVMGMKNIRLMTKQTSDAIVKLGIDGNQMSQQLSNGSLTVFDALKQVASELKNVDSNSKTAGEVMQTVFGRQGAMAGTNLAKAIETLNTNLKETKEQTGELGDAFAELQTANEKLNTAIRDAFSYDGWEQMATGIKAKLVSAIADVLNILDGIRASWGDLMDKMGLGSGNNNFKPIGGGLYNSLPRTTREPSENADELKKSQDKKTTYNRQVSAYNAQIDEKRQQVKAMTPGDGMPDLMKDTREKLKAEIQEIEKIRDKYKELAKDILNPPKAPTGNVVGSGSGGGKTGGGGSVATVAKELNPMQQAQKEISALTEEALTADDGRLEVIKQEIAALNEQAKLYKEIQDYVNGTKKISTVVGVKPDQIRQMEEELKKSFTGVNLSEMIRDLKSQIANSEIGSDFYNSLTSKIADATALQNLIKVAIEKGIDQNNFNANSLWEALLSAEGISDEQLQEVVDYINQFMGEHPIKLNVDTGSVSSDGKDTSDSWKEAAKAVQSVGQAFNQIEDPAAKVAGTLAQAIASVALGYATATTQAATMGPWAWVAFAASGLAQMVATISTIKSVAHFAEGGIVGGNDYTDNTLIGVSSGELILNRSQQESIASQLQEENQTQVSRLPYVTGEKVVLGINNWARSTGRGQLVFSKEL